MNILYLVPYVPNLIRVRPYNLIRHLTGQGQRVTVLTLWSGEGERVDIQKLEQICQQVYSAPLSRYRSFLNSLIALPSRNPLQANYCWQPLLHNRLVELALGGNGTPSYDVVHVEHLRGVKYALELKSHFSRERRIPIVWDSVDSISMLFRQAAGASKSFFGRWLTRFELGRTERYERWLAGQFERLLVTSQVDKEAFLSLQPSGFRDSRITVLPNGVDLDYFSQDNSVPREPASLVLSGKMSYHANITMALHLAEKIMPLVWEKRPEVKVYIVGKDPSKEVKSLGDDPRITVTGTVPDIRPYLRKASISVTPIMYGAGIQNKVLEAMACATPVVSTTRATAALAIKPGQDLITADDPVDFAEAVLGLLDNPGLRREVGEAGRRYVETHHSWVNIARKLIEVYRESIDGQEFEVLWE
jgi:sugar transferase (PEP-CTERM/EpsH1 system associated)